MGGRKKYIPLEITQKGSSFRVQSLSWTALLLCTLRFNNVIGAGAARLSLFGLAAVPVTVKSYIWTLTCYYTTAGKYQTWTGFAETLSKRWNLFTEATLHVPFASMEQPHVLEQNGISTFQMCAPPWWDSNPSLQKTSLIPNPCLTAKQGRKGWGEAGGSKRQRERDTTFLSRSPHYSQDSRRVLKNIWP